MTQPPLPAAVVPVLAVAQLGVPVALGLALTRGRGWAAVAAVLAGAVALVAADLAVCAVDLWDVVLVSVGLAVGVALSRVPARALARGLVGGLLFLTVAEVAGRFVLTAHAGVYEVVDESPWFEARNRFGEDACVWFAPSDALVARAARVTVYAPGPVAADTPRVVHVGDSLLGFGPLAPDLEDREDLRRFPYFVAADDPAHAHVNASLPGVGLDGYLVATRALVEALPVSHVVVYFFPGNDLDELWREYPCCPGGPLVERTTLAPRCPPWTPLPARGTVDALVLRSPAPLAVRWLHDVSPTFGQLRAAAVRWRAFRNPLATELGSYAIDFQGDVLEAHLDEAARVLVALSHELDGRGVRLTVVGLPFGPALADPADRTLDTTRAQVRGLATRLSAAGVRTIDAWPAFDGAPYDPAWFMPDGAHFDEAGHRRLAAWLGPKLAE